MKKHILLFILLAFSNQIIYCQSYNQELLKSYSNNELKEISQNNSNEIELLNYAIDHACYIVQKPALEKTSRTSTEGTTIKLPFIEIKNQPDLGLKKVKFTDLQLKITDRNQYFLIKDSNQMLVVKSKWVLQNEIDQIK